MSIRSFLVLLFGALTAQFSWAEDQVLQAKLEGKAALQSLDFFQDKSAALYAVGWRVTMTGEFNELPTGKFYDVFVSQGFGNAFAVDALGNIMTCAHVVSPQEAMNSLCDSLEIKKVNSIFLEYSLLSLDGRAYYTKYEVQSSWATVRIDSVVASAVILWDMEEVAFGRTGRILIKAIDQPADLALMHIPNYGNAYLAFRPIHEVSSDEDIYRVSLSNSNFDNKPLLTPEASWGQLEIPCLWVQVGNGEGLLVSGFRLVSYPGNSGGAMVDTQGRVVCMVQAINSDGETFGVSAEYIQAFYRYATQPGTPAPELVCPPCCQ